MSDRSEQPQPADAGPVDLKLGQAAEADDLAWHALNYRTAAPQHAEAMWQELLACVRRKLAAERERCAAKAAPERIPFSDEEWRIRCEIRDAILEA